MIPANQLCMMCDAAGGPIGSVLGGAGPNVKLIQNVDCTLLDRYLGRCVNGANGMGDCQLPNMPAGKCFNNFKQYNLEPIAPPPPPPG